jgi:hypothetical protein
MAVIYSGGLQTWQNIEKMLEAAAMVKKVRYVFLSGEAGVLSESAAQAGVCSFECRAVQPQEVADYYLRCTFGFVLRSDTIINNVACPTKLVEYMYWGVIPIVLTSHIGDFEAYGFRYITLEDFIQSSLPDDASIAIMRASNRDAVDRLIATSDERVTELRALLLAHAKGEVQTVDMQRGGC